ncbi:unnamed protein product [Pleuronectes platessa]|uniref:Uncharacterized protein n=1 Tax=Pleuronectes platessa TaxID=8262 RepID=A0A9N7YBW3_PLEPL|nr:unnamed protein product [Pleuronectes platessa]
MQPSERRGGGDLLWKFADTNRPPAPDLWQRMEARRVRKQMLGGGPRAERRSSPVTLGLGFQCVQATDERRVHRRLRQRLHRLSAVGNIMRRAALWEMEGNCVSPCDRRPTVQIEALHGRTYESDIAEVKNQTKQLGTSLGVCRRTTESTSTLLKLAI